MEVAGGVVAFILGIALLAWSVRGQLAGRRNTAKPTTVVVEPDGLTIEDRRGRRQIPWTSITQVTLRPLDGGPWRDEFALDIAGRTGRATVHSWEPQADLVLARLAGMGADPRAVVEALLQPGAEPRVLLGNGSTAAATVPDPARSAP